MRTSKRFSHRTTVSMRKPASFLKEKRDSVVILVQGFAKMLSKQVTSSRFGIFQSAKGSVISNNNN